MKTNEITPVTLKSGKEMYHVRNHDGRHIFFNRIVAMNYWTIGILAFIVVASILVAFLQMSVTVDVGNNILQALSVCKGGSYPSP
jgi:uncharacterized BrkB/YihY/UPF0761 family membrane protein